MRTRPTIDTSDEEIGRGRNNDSSSSRESSPRPGRSFSPVSDDDDLAVSSSNTNEPPPPERPLLRQPVAFTAATTSKLNTYQANVSAPTAPNAFLPGQAVVIPRKRKSKSASAPRKRKQNDYGGQTSRFRLKLHEPSSSIDSRAATESSSTIISADHPPSVPRNEGPVVQAFLSEPVSGSSRDIRIPEKKSMTSSRKPQPTVITKWSVADQPSGMASIPKQSTGKSMPLDISNPPQLAPVPYDVPPAAFGKSGFPQSGHHLHYRKLHGPGTPHSPPTYPNRSHPSTPPFYPFPKPPFLPDVTQPAAPSYVAQRSPGGRISLSESRRQQKQPLVMLTLLIQDIRSGVTDNQLAEVKLPMKLASNPNDGFWVDAKLLGQQLQSSASRIDGPAKAYTLRGKYRQFFLRVTAEGVDEFISTDLAIKLDRILDVVVEELLPPGQLPLPPRIPRGLVDSPKPGSSRSPTPERGLYSQHPYPDHSVLPYTEPLELRQHDYSQASRHTERFRRPSESVPRRSYSASISSSSLSSTEDLRPKTVTHEWQSRFGNWPRSLSPRMSMSPGPTITTSVSAPSTASDARPDPSSSKDASAEVHRLVSEYIGEIVREDPGWTDFLKARAALEPHRASDVLAQYRFVKAIIDKWAGQRAPLASCDVDIDHSHITRALKIDDPYFASNCIETLVLLNLYGLKGRHHEDPRVVELVNDAAKPAHNAQPIQSLLQLMQDLDKQWRENHPISKPEIGKQL